VKRAAVLSAALVLGLSGCGGSGGDDPTLASSASPGTTTAPAAQECPVKATEVPAPEGSTTDLSKKPVIKGSKAKAPTEVQVADIVEGTGDEATTLSAVEAKYVGAIYETGKEFDSSWKTSADQTLPFTVCSTEVIPGFSIAPTGMKVGGRRQVTIPALYGYGEQGSEPAIPGGATLVFVIDLVKVTPPAG